MGLVDGVCLVYDYSVQLSVQFSKDNNWVFDDPASLPSKRMPPSAGDPANLAMAGSNSPFFGQ